MTLDQKTFESLSQRIYRWIGLSSLYNEKNLVFFNTQLAPLLSRFQLKTWSDLDLALDQPSEELRSAFISALTVKKTLFFREEDHFHFVHKEIFPRLKTQSEVRVWSAACSYGPEAYSLALLAAEQLAPQERIRFQILATDVDIFPLQKARGGLFLSTELEGLTSLYLQKYFTTQDQQSYQLHPEVVKMVHFSQMNLLEAVAPITKKFDVIFCRNVLLHFDQVTTEKVVEQLVAHVELNGYFVVGHSESGVVRHRCLKSLGRAIYQKVKN